MTEGELSAGDYLTVAKRHWRLIVAITVLVTVVSFGWSSRKTAQYSSRADLLIDFDLTSQADPSGGTGNVTERARRAGQFGHEADLDFGLRSKR